MQVVREGGKMFLKRDPDELPFVFKKAEFDHVQGNAALWKEAVELCRHVPLDSYAVKVLLGQCKGQCKKRKTSLANLRGPNTCGHCFETQAEDTVKPWYECEACLRNCHAECADLALGRKHLPEDAYFCPECIEEKAAKRAWLEF